MDTDTLVENLIDDGRKLIRELVRDNFDVTVACWLKTSEEGRWFLYIASKVVDEKGLAEAYRAVYPALQRLPDPYISMSELKLISPNNPIARDALMVRNHHPGRIVTRYRGQQLGGVPIDEAHIYSPAPLPQTPSEVAARVIELMQRRGTIRPSLVTMKDGSVFQGIPAGFEFNTGGPMNVKFIDMTTNAPRVLPADAIAAVD